MFGLTLLLTVAVEILVPFIVTAKDVNEESKNLLNIVSVVLVVLLAIMVIF